MHLGEDDASKTIRNLDKALGCIRVKQFGNINNMLNRHTHAISTIRLKQILVRACFKAS